MCESVEMSMVFYAETFVEKFQIGTELTKDQFTDWLEEKGLLEPVVNDWDSNEVMGYEQNVQRLRNQINYVSVALETGYRIDILERDKTLVVRNIKDAVVHESKTYVRKIVKQVQ